MTTAFTPAKSTNPHAGERAENQRLAAPRPHPAALVYPYPSRKAGIRRAIADLRRHARSQRDLRVKNLRICAAIYTQGLWRARAPPWARGGSRGWGRRAPPGAVRDRGFAMALDRHLREPLSQARARSSIQPRSRAGRRVQKLIRTFGHGVRNRAEGGAQRSLIVERVGGPTRPGRGLLALHEAQRLPRATDRCPPRIDVAERDRRRLIVRGAIPGELDPEDSGRDGARRRRGIRLWTSVARREPEGPKMSDTSARSRSRPVRASLFRTSSTPPRRRSYPPTVGCISEATGSTRPR
jgi:hypothetical protein